MKRWLLLGTLLLLPVFLLAACGAGRDGGGQGAAAGSPAKAGADNEVMVTLAEQNNSGESGTAMLIANGDKTRVVLRMQNPTTDSQPAHIHRGTCKELDPNPLYGLVNVIHGRSTTTVDVPLSELTSGGLAINVHQSNANLDRYVACGKLPGGSANTAPTDGVGY